MGGKVLKLQSEKLLAKGEAEGRAEEIFDSVQAGDYSIARGAEKLGITIETFKKRMTEAGYKLPVSV